MITSLQEGFGNTIKGTAALQYGVLLAIYLAKTLRFAFLSFPSVAETTRILYILHAIAAL